MKIIIEATSLEEIRTRQAEIEKIFGEVELEARLIGDGREKIFGALGSLTADMQEKLAAIKTKEEEKCME